MAQNIDVALPQIQYTRVDYTALRAYCLRLSPQIIAKQYYRESDPQVTGGLEKFLQSMQQSLIERAIDHNPQLATSLQHVRRGGHISAGTLKLLIDFADMPPAVPRRSDFLSRWFKPGLVSAMKSEEISTIQDLITAIEARGAGWWRSIPRVGQGRAQVLLKWLRAHEKTIGTFHVDETSIEVPAPVVVLDPARPGQLAPLGRFGVLSHLDGSQGINRHPKFSFIAAQNDLQAVQSCLLRYRHQKLTLRAYTKELERFLLWSLMVAKKPMSSLLVDDIEAYKDFMRFPSPEFKGPRAGRFSPRWKPFSDAVQGLSEKSQRYAFFVISSMFDYLVKVRYLGGNPFAAVAPPRVTKRLKTIQTEKALPEKLWDSLIDELSTRAEAPTAKQERIALASLLLLGDSGLRRHEAAKALRTDLKGHSSGRVSTLTVIGKGNKERLVPVSARTLTALRNHWEDRCLDFHDPANASRSLIAPLMVPKTQASIRKAARAGDPSSLGYSPDGLYRLVKSCLRKVAKGTVLEDSDIERLLASAPHAFRHTFGSLTANKMPLPIVQRMLGHNSLNTTSVYVVPEEERMVVAMAEYYGDLAR